MLYDNHNRPINYMRLAVTDRCNLRCFYCMPEKGIDYVDRKDLLTFEEMHRLIDVFSKLGVNKLRITGGEPFVRKGIMDFMQNVASSTAVEKINITTNGTFTSEFIPQLEAMGVSSVNLSLDSLDAKRFHQITRRDLFKDVMNTFDALVASTLDVKINMVVMQGRNIEDILPMIELTKDLDVSVRFIEEMPFNGTTGQGNATFWPSRKTLEYVESHLGKAEKLEDGPSSTSLNYRVPGYTGSFGLISAYTRSFCGSCNRIRITPQGTLRTCLYGSGIVSFRDLMRDGASDEELGTALKHAINKRAKDGFEAEKLRKAQRPVSESMATIGG